jgi:hypothetical protein
LELFACTLDGMWRVYGGAVAVVAGIAAFIEAHSHQPGTVTKVRPGEALREALENARFSGHAPEAAHVGLSNTAYDLLRIGAWAFVILGALTVVLGLIRYRADARI